MNGTASDGAYCELTDELASGQSSVSPMLFLLNDVVFDLDEACPATPADERAAGWVRGAHIDWS